jgi:hypothetical protein
VFGGKGYKRIDDFNPIQNFSFTLFMEEFVKKRSRILSLPFTDNSWNLINSTNSISNLSGTCFAAEFIKFIGKPLRAFQARVRVE